MTARVSPRIAHRRRHRLAMSPSPRPHPLHAVVIGAGLDGLAAVQALGRHLERVTLIERGDLPDHVVAGTSRRSRHRHELRLVLDAPQVVVRAGLEAVALAVESGHVVGVVVRSRRADVRPTTVTIAADLVVDASGTDRGRTTPAPDGLVVVSAGAGGGAAAGVGAMGASPDGAVQTAASTAAALGRCLASHLSRRADLTGFSSTAQRAVDRTRSAARATAS